MFKKFTTGRLARRVQPEVASEPAAPVPSARTGADPAPPVLDPHAPPVLDPHAPPVLDPHAPPDYFGGVAHHANSPLPKPDPSGRVVPGTGLRKFVDALPGLGAAHANDLGNYLPVAVPDTVTYPGCDYYEIGLQEYEQRLHKDLPATRLRGYRQLNHGTDTDGRNTVAPPDRPFYLGPVIRAQRDRPVRIRFVNLLPAGAAGRLFLPVDPTVPGAGPGPLGGTDTYPQNRAVLHLRGGHVPWISAGSPRQWITPAAEAAQYRRGVSTAGVPDMPEPGAGAVTLYYPNGQSGRLLWFHDQTEGLARLNVYAGQLGLYLLDDPVERRLVDDGVIPAEQIPLVIEDKTFVPDDAQLAAQDPTWDVASWGGRGSLWYPHVYLPRQHPYDESGSNPVGRWDYGPWCRPTRTGPVAHGPVPNPYHDPARPSGAPLAPGTPTPSLVPGAYHDTPLVNGTAYPYLRVRPGAYRFRILNACGDRSLNLQLYRAASDGELWNPDGSPRDADAGEVPVISAAPDPALPAGWPTDGRPGGVPDPAAAGPDWIQIGTEGGLLPAVAVLPNRPVNYEYRRRDSAVLNVIDHTLLLGPGERADVIIDFSSVPPGANLILYNDCPAPIPGFDPRYDYYTGAPDQRARGGAPATRAGFGPNTRTLMQFQVVGVPAPPFDLATLRERLPRAYAASQPPPIVPQPVYDAAFGTGTPRHTFAAIQDRTLTFTPAGASGPVTLPLRATSIGQLFEPEYGRRVTALGVGPPEAGASPRAAIPLAHVDPPTETIFPGDPAAQLGSPQDGTELWRIGNRGPDTHFVHFGFGTVQLVNRVGWDGAIRPPGGNELGWKETVRVDPREDTIVAVRPAVPALPFKLGDSVRAHDPTRAAGSTGGLTQVDPRTGRPVTVVNQVTNFGWEYAWYASPLGLRDGGARRPVVLRVGPAQPTGLTATPVPGSQTVPPAVGLVWTNNASRPPATANVVERATDATFATGRTAFRVPAGGRAYTDSGVTPRTTYYYRVRAENTAGYSAWSNTVGAAVQLSAPTGLAAAIPPDPPLRAALRWNNQSFATAVEIQRATNPTFTSGLTLVSVRVASSHVDGTVAPETTYYYRVRTSYLGAASAWSNITTAIAPGAPAVPTGLTAAAGEPDGMAVVLAWAQDPASVVTGFLLQGATDPIFSTGLTSVTVAGNARTCTVTGLNRGTTYYYRVQAVNPAGGSAFTNPVPITVSG